MDEATNAVGAALVAALSSDADARRHAENILSQASASSAFCAALLAASAPTSGLPDPARLLAATSESAIIKSA